MTAPSSHQSAHGAGDRRLAAIFEQTAAGMAEVTLEGRFARVNQRYSQIVGRSCDELLGLRMQDITDPQDLPGNVALFERLIETGEPFEIEKHYLRPDGSRARVKNNVSLIRSQDGDALSVLAVCVEVTEDLTAEIRFRTVFENAAVGMIEIDADWCILGANHAYSEITGYTVAELIGMSSLAFTHPDDIATSETALHSVAVPGAERTKFEKRYIRKDGRLVWIRSNLSRVSGEGRSARFLKVVEDITDIRQARDALEEQGRVLETLHRTGASLSGELDLSRVVQMVTDAGVELTGAQFGAFFYNVIDEQGERYMLNTLSGAEPAQFAFDMPRNTAVFHTTFSGEGTLRSNDIIQDPRYGKSAPHYGLPEGHLPVRSYLAVPVIGRSGEVLGGLFFGHAEPARFTDTHERLMLGIAAQAAISIDNARLYQAVQRANETLEQRVDERTQELENANEALRQAQKMEAIGQLTGGIAHDFNNMLTVIRGSADVLRRPDLAAEKRQRYLDAIAETSDRAARLTSQLLAFARRQALKPETFDALDRVKGIAEMLRTVLGSRFKLQITAECDECFVEADAAQFETALVNMAVNARDAMDSEGELRIGVSRVSELPRALQPQSSEAYVAVSVSDTGHGIAPDDLAKIFEPFFTTKEVGKGTGLGLSQVYGFAKQSGGEVGVESEPGNGTTFTLYLPEAQTTRGEAVAETQQAKPSLQPGTRVLVVEDNDEVGSFAEQALTELDCEVQRAWSADAALKMLEDGGDFEIVFSDVVMPGMSGIEFARLVEVRWPGLPVVLTSGYSHVLAGQSHGFQLLQKPYSLEGLQQALGEALSRRG